MMPTFSTIFSGIGGADWGLQHAGWEPRWQCEQDPWRRNILAARFPGAKLHRWAQDLLASGAEPVDLLYVHPPSGDPEWLALAWPVVEALRPRFFVMEVGCRCIPSLKEWCARLGYGGLGLSVGLEQRASWLPLPLARAIPFSVGWRGPREALAEAFRAPSPVVMLRDGPTGPPRTTVEIVERTKGLPCGWSCVCGEEDPWKCRESSQRLVAVNEASAPDLARWIGERLLPLVARQEG